MLTHFVSRLLLTSVLFLTCFANIVCSGATAQDELLVSDNFSNQILRYDGTTGAFLGVLVSGDPGVNGGLDAPVGMRISANNTLLVASQNTNSILEYNRFSGAFLGVWASTNMNGPADMRFGNDGNLYVANFFGNSVTRFDSFGNPLGVFTSGGPGIAGTASINFSPGATSNLYVGNFNGSDVQVFDGTTGSFISQFATGFAGAAGLYFDIDDTVWVASLFTGDISHFAADGTPLGNFSTGATSFPSYIEINPNNTNELLIALTGAGGVYRFGKDGTPLGVFAAGGGLLVPGQFLFASAIPEPNSLFLMAITGVALFTRRRCRTNSAST
ncbi:MAG TPA: PEP-CTERM sorting domain-containing protein [Pirellulaceae bacterium]|nr:PEP-CTERM sorting domain-containing protein [Pirellulaceae bacterium]HMO90867.1 PEP-CTERM sorting domain-containing protein [Pirellulaceae bacterium]HMP68657.1 PEP-CTERM sorting domain-containing protein [Pirellulaceae bacterium]